MKTESALLILSPGFAKDESDDSCLTSQQHLVRSFNKLYPDIKIIILAFQYPFVKKRYEWHGNTVIAFNGRNRGGLWRRWIWMQVRKELQNLGQTYLIKGLLSFWLGEAALVASRFARIHRLPHFCWMLGQDARPANPYVQRIQPSARELVTISDFVSDEFETNYTTRPAHVIPNGVEPSQFSFDAQQRDIDIISVGSLIPLKRFDWVIDAVLQLKEAFPGIKAMIVGDGPEKKDLQKKINRLGLEKNITLTGALDHGSVLILLQRSKLLLHPSSYEGFATVCLEALYAGCCVISTLQPMHAAIDNWYIVNDVGEIVQKVKERLPVYSPVIPDNFLYTMDRSAAAFMALYD